MANTPHLALPLIDGGQAQKHVTVNEALTRLDALTLATTLSSSLTEPPATPLEGDRYIVAAGAVGDWTGGDAQIAVFVNGGWDLVEPEVGWRVFLVDEGVDAVFDGLDWKRGALAVSAVGAAAAAAVIWFDHAVAAGATSDTSVAIPDRSIVLGVTGRVISPIAGASSWRLGVAGAEDRYGSGLGIALNSEAHGPMSAPVAYYGDTPLRLSADGGDFSSGTVRLAIHLMRLTPPAAV